MIEHRLYKYDPLALGQYRDKVYDFHVCNNNRIRVQGCIRCDAGGWDETSETSMPIERARNMYRELKKEGYIVMHSSYFPDICRTVWKNSV
jgi:hypothetical protein